MNRVRLSALAASFLVASWAGVALGATPAAAGYTHLPLIVFPTACPVLESYDEYGTADLTLTVDSNGLVGNVVVDRSSGYPRLDEAFRLALGKSRVVPGTVDGKPQPMPVSVRMEARPHPARHTAAMISLTVMRGSLPRVAEYNCRFGDPHPYTPTVSSGPVEATMRDYLAVFAR